MYEGGIFTSIYTSLSSVLYIKSNTPFWFLDQVHLGRICWYDLVALTPKHLACVAAHVPLNSWISENLFQWTLSVVVVDLVVWAGHLCLITCDPGRRTEWSVVEFITTDRPVVRAC